MPALRPGRIVFDVSSAVRWSGPPVGIARAERELIKLALAERSDVVYVFFDPGDRAFREVDRALLARFVEGTAVADMLGWGDATGHRRHLSDRIPRGLRPAMFWVTQTRRMVLRTLEHHRLHGGSARLRRVAARLQQATTAPKYRAMLTRPDGRRRDFLTREAIAGPLFQFRPGDTLVCAGSSWTHVDIDAVGRLKRDAGLRFALLCNDLIPLQFPQFYKPHDVRNVEHYYRHAFPLADQVICSSATVRRDVEAWCHDKDLRLNPVVVNPLGADGVARDPVAPLPEGLRADRYLLFVSTIEPRKGHRVLYNAWIRLLEDGIPQRMGFKMVFVGRPGWFVDDLLATLRSDVRIRDSLLMLQGVGDDTLATLYAKAAFCVYPSQYEGYGLPVVESLLHGKPVITSTGGSLPEVVGGFSPCLDPHDEPAWYRTIKAWIVDPSERHALADRIRREFRAISWTEASRGFFARLDATETASSPPEPGPQARG